MAADFSRRLHHIFDYCPGVRDSPHLGTPMNERVTRLEALLKRVLEWTPALPAESGLLDEIAAALQVEPGAPIDAGLRFKPVLERAYTKEGWTAEMEQAHDGEWVHVSALNRPTEPPAGCPHCREVYEIWANTEGFTPLTAPESYQQRAIEQMRLAAAKGLALNRGAEPT